MSVLTEDDINFIIKSLDSVSCKGIQANLKMGEVFLKLQGMLQEMDSVQEMVPE